MPTENDPLHGLPDLGLVIREREKKKKVKKKKPYWAKNLYRRSGNDTYRADLFRRSQMSYTDDGLAVGKGGGFVEPEVSQAWVAVRLRDFNLHNNVKGSTKSQTSHKARLRKVKRENDRDFPRFTGIRREGLGAYRPFPPFVDPGRES